jgi:SAM-dependent methyltransferase
MDRATVDVYEARAAEWLERRGPDAHDDLGRRFREQVGDGLVADLGCGTGRYLTQIGRPVAGLDVTAAMLELAARHGEPLVRGDLERLPFRDGALAGVFARHSYLHLPRERLAFALGEARRVLRPHGLLLLTLIEGDFEGHDLPSDDFPGRYFAFWTAGEVGDLVEGAGFVEVAVERIRRVGSQWDLLVTGRS